MNESSPYYVGYVCNLDMSVGNMFIRYQVIEKVKIFSVSLTESEITRNRAVPRDARHLYRKLASNPRAMK